MSDLEDQQVHIVTVNPKWLSGDYPCKIPNWDVETWLWKNVGDFNITWCHIGGADIGLFTATDAIVFKLRYG